MPNQKYFIDQDGDDLIKITNLKTRKVFRVPKSTDLNILKDRTFGRGA